MVQNDNDERKKENDRPQNRFRAIQMITIIRKGMPKIQNSNVHVDLPAMPKRNLSNACKTMKCNN